MEINLYNIEELLFYNFYKIKQILPKFNDLFDKWKPFLSDSQKRILHLELLNSLDDQDIQKLSDFWNQPVQVKKVDSDVIKHYQIDLNEDINSLDLYKNVSIHRDKDKIYIITWR